MEQGYHQNILNLGLDFVNFGSKMYIELFTYLCRKIIKLALCTHFNSAIKCFICQNISFVVCPIVLKWSFWRNEWQNIYMFSRSIDKNGIMAESTIKGKEYYCTGKNQRCKKLQSKYFSNVCKVISVKSVTKVYMYLWIPFSPLYIFCTDTVFKQFFLGYSPIDMSETSHNNLTIYGNSILLVVTEEFCGNSAQNFCNIPQQLIIAHNSGPKYICGKKIL